MLKHTDYDSSFVLTENVDIPEIIHSISVSHDGGRLYIHINNSEVYCAMSGTRDCCIELTREQQ